MGTAPGPQGMMGTSVSAQQGPLSPPRGHPGALPQGMMAMGGTPAHYMGYYPAPYFPAQSAGNSLHMLQRPPMMLSAIYIIVLASLSFAIISLLAKVFMGCSDQVLL